MMTQRKIPGSVKKWKVSGIKYITTVKHQIKIKRLTKDHGGFQQRSPQRLVDIYDHMNSRNDPYMMCLKTIEAEYYSIEN